MPRRVTEPALGVRWGSTTTAVAAGTGAACAAGRPHARGGPQPGGLGRGPKGLSDFSRWNYTFSCLGGEF